MSHTQIESVLSLFPPQVHDLLVHFTAEQTSYDRDRCWLQHTTGYDIAEGQHPCEAEIKCSDSRVTDPHGAATGAGVKLSHRLPGGFGTAPSCDRLSDAAEEIHELAGAYNVPFIKIGQHSDCGAMKCIYNFFKNEEGPQYIKTHYGPGFYHMAESREKLFRIVDDHIKNEGYAYYEKYGLYLGRTEEAKYQTCLSIEEGLNTLRAVKEKIAKYPNLHLPQPVLLYKHVIEDGHYYCFEEKTGIFIMLPRISSLAKLPL